MSNSTVLITQKDQKLSQRQLAKELKCVCDAPKGLCRRQAQFKERNLPLPEPGCGLPPTCGLESPVQISVRRVKSHHG